MKFFLPHAQTEDLAEHTYEAIKLFVKDNLRCNISDRRIFRIEYFNGKDHEAEVGKVTDVNGEEVIAILESFVYLVCTPNRGVLRGMPILVGTNEVFSISDFE